MNQRDVLTLQRRLGAWQRERQHYLDLLRVIQHRQASAFNLDDAIMQALRKSEEFRVRYHRAMALCPGCEGGQWHRYQQEQQAEVRGRCAFRERC